MGIRCFAARINPWNVDQVNDPVLIVRPDDGPIGPKHVALYVLLMVTIDELDENINTLFKHVTHRDKYSYVKLGKVVPKRLNNAMVPHRVISRNTVI